MALNAAQELNAILRRQNGCISCPTTPPTCKGFVCPSGQACSISIQTCNTCSAASCIQLTQTGGNTQPTQPAKSSSAPVGAIVGGVMGFLVIVCIGAYFLIKRNKKKQKEAYEASIAAWAPEKDHSLGGLRDARASTHTVGSIASTVFTRASNVIQIAYIPGVTNLSHPNSPSHIPPVPSIPGGHMQSPGDQQFFSAEDILRQSMWSTHSGVSLGADPRASVATTIYQKNAIVSPLAATAVRAKAAVVTVKSSPAPSSGASSPRTTASNSPPVPHLDLSKFPSPRPFDGLLSPTSATRPPPSPAFSVGSTFLNKKSVGSRPDTSGSRASRAVSVGESDNSPFSDRASIDGDTVGPLRTFNNAGRTSPARYIEGDIRMSFRPVSEVESDAGTESPLSPDERGRSPFGDENRVKR